MYHNVGTREMIDYDHRPSCKYFSKSSKSFCSNLLCFDYTSTLQYTRFTRNMAKVKKINVIFNQIHAKSQLVLIYVA